MKSLREWATPLTIGTFALVGVTGVLMFFHIATALNKNVHEWGGLVMIIAVVVHVVANWPVFKRYFIAGNLARIIIGLCLVVLAGSFITLSGRQAGGPPMMRTFNTVVHAPLANVAALLGETPEQVIASLAKIDIHVSDPQQSLDAITDGNREKQQKAVVALFGQKKE